MQIFDRKKYRLFGVINLIDVLVIVAVLVAGFAIYRVLAPAKATTTAAAEVEVAYTVMCPNLRGVSAEQVKVGDKIYKTTGKEIGTVKNVRMSPSPGDAWDTKENTIRHYDSTVNSDIFIDVTAKGTPTSSGFVVGDLLLHGGNQSVPVMTSTFECDTATIATLTVVGQ